MSQLATCTTVESNKVEEIRELVGALEIELNFIQDKVKSTAIYFESKFPDQVGQYGKLQSKIPKEVSNKIKHSLSPEKESDLQKLFKAVANITHPDKSNGDSDLFIEANQYRNSGDIESLELLHAQLLDTTLPTVKVIDLLTQSVNRLKNKIAQAKTTPLYEIYYVNEIEQDSKKAEFLFFKFLLGLITDLELKIFESGLG